MGTVSPHVTFHVAAPPTTAAIMSRTSGPRDQTVTFSPDNKTITWTISQFPGGSYAQAFIRVSISPCYANLFFLVMSLIFVFTYILIPDVNNRDRDHKIIMYGGTTQSP